MPVDGSDDKSRESSAQDLSEPLIIALAALQSLNCRVAMTDDGNSLPPGLLHVFSHQQGDTEQESEFEKWKKALTQKALAGEDVLVALDEAISEHLKKFKDELNEEKQKRFLKVAGGIVLN